EAEQAQAVAELAPEAADAADAAAPAEPQAAARVQAAPEARTQATQQAQEQAQEQATEQADAQRQAEEARRVAEEAQAAAEAAAADEAQAQQLRDQALTAASVAAAALIAASQAEHATTENPYPSGEDAEAGTIAAIQGPEVPAEAPVVEDDLWTEDDYVELEDLGSGSPQSSGSLDVPEAPITSDAGSISLSDVTESASELVTGDRAAQIETVIARAMA